MGNQLAATPTVDLANVSSDLELIAPLGAEGRNYFATFQCFYYTPLSSTASAGSTFTTRASLSSPHRTSPLRDNDPGFNTDFYAADGLSRRSEYCPNSLYYPSTGAVSSPLSARTASSRSAVRGRGCGSVITYSTSSGSTAPTTQLASSERAAWHQARWRQRLPVAVRPWCVSLAHFSSEAAPDRCPARNAMDCWCRDSTAASLAFPHDGCSRIERHTGSSSAARCSSPPSTPPLVPLPHLSSPVTPATSFYATDGGGATSATDIDTTVASVVGEWRGNYGNYVQLLLHGGSSASRNKMALAAFLDGKIVSVNGSARISAAAGASGTGFRARSTLTAAMTMTMPSALSAATTNNITNNNNGGSPTLPLQSYMIHNVVTKVFVRPQDDPGQTYFLKHVRQMMENAGKQLTAVNSTLPPNTPRNCLWYSLAYEGEGFCVLQRPYVAFTLRERLAARPVWTAREKLFVAFQLLQAVAHLHDTYGLTHGDIKPNNVLVQSTGVVVLADMAPFKPCWLPLDSPLLFDYYYDTDESRACYVAPEKFSDQPLPSPPLESKTPGNATYNVGNLNFDGHTASMDIFSTACVLLFLYREQDPFTLAEVLNLHHLSSVEAREKVVLPVLRKSGVPSALQPLLKSMLCNSSADRPSARELLTRGLVTCVFPACFHFLYHDVWPRLLTQPPDLRLRLFQNQLEVLLRRCAEMDTPPAEVGRADLQKAKSSCVGKHNESNNSCATAVCVLLPLLLQTIHSTETNDEATFRGLLCLRQCAAYCTFDALTDLILPHLVYFVNDNAHVYGPATRLVALRLLCSVAETIARQLTSAQRSENTIDGGTTDLSSLDAEATTCVHSSGEEQWAFMEHLVLPCLYDILRQNEQESSAVLVELAERLPRLLLLTRFLTERRQALYVAEKDADAMMAQSQSRNTPPSSEGSKAPAKEQKVEEEVTKIENEAVQFTLAILTLTPEQSESCRSAANAGDGKVNDKESSASAAIRSVAQEQRDTNGVPHVSHTATQRTEAAPPRPEGEERSNKQLEFHGGSITGVAQYLAQLRCLLRNGWNMLQILYNHPCVAVAAAMMRQTTSTVAAFLGDECVAEDLIPLLTTTLTAPLRVLRLLFPQAILLHALLQKPQAKTLRLFVEEGLRHGDDVCVKSTLDSVAVVVRSTKLPLVESMALVHQTLPFLMDMRLWLREAACGVVEAAAQSYPPSDIALHLEYAVRPMLTHPVPLSQLRRFAPSIIRSELAATRPPSGFSSAVALSESRGFSGDISMGCARESKRGEKKNGEWCLPNNNDKMGGTPSSTSFLASTDNNSHSDANSPSWPVDYRDALPSVVSATSSSNHAAAPALLHLLPPSKWTTTTTTSATVTLLANSETAGDKRNLTYRLAAREAARVEKEIRSVESTTTQLPSCAASAAASPAATSASCASTFTSLRLHGQLNPSAALPHVVELSPFPRTLAPHSSLCRCEVPVLTSRGGDTAFYLSSSVSSSPLPPSVLSSTAVVAETAVAFPPSSPSGHFNFNGPSSSTVSASAAAVATTRYATLRPIAVPLSSVSAHIGAIYTAAAAPSANGVVVTAGARGEAIIWRVDAAATSVVQTRELALVERVALPDSSSFTTTTVGKRDYMLSRSSEFSYVSSQWMDVAPLRRDCGSCSEAASTSSGARNTVALASTDGVVRLLDVERNTWLWSNAVGGGLEGAPTGLALQDRRCLLVATAAGGLHVVDTRCNGVGNSAAASGSAWCARWSPSDGAPSCLLPLYLDDRACAAVVGTYGGVVCLYDLRFQLCAQRTVMTASLTTTMPSASQEISITCGCVDPLSSLCRGCRPGSWEAAVPGPSVLLGTTTGAVFRLLLQSNALGAYWPAFQCGGARAGDTEKGKNSGVRCILSQPSKGSVFTGSEDGYIRHWSTDHPETSHTVTCVPYASPLYAVTQNSLAGSPDSYSAHNHSGANVDDNGHSLAIRYGTKRLAMLTVRENNDSGVRRALPHHASDAILTLCAVQTEVAACSSSTLNGSLDGHSCLLSGSRDGTLTLWNNLE